MKTTVKNAILLFCLLHVYTFIACSKETIPTNTGVELGQQEESATNTVSVLITTSNRAYDLTKRKTDLNNKLSMSPNTVTLNPNVTYQTMDGFGAAITGSTCYNLSLMTESNRKEFLKETFSPTEGLGFSYIRISIGCSDFSLSEYTCCDKKGIENFALTVEETKYIIPILKQIISINPSIKILGSPWTCPKWMKVNNLKDKQTYDSWTGGQLNPEYYQDYGNYFIKWIQAFKNEGINIYAITPQNEPLNRGNSASLYMGWEEQRDFIATALGPKLKAAELNTKIYVFDHNYNYDNIASQQGYPVNIYADNKASSYITGAAYHNYGGNRSELNNIHKAAPNKELLFTETSIGTWNSGRDLQKRLLADMNDIAIGTVNNWCKGVMVWNLMLDSDLGPNRKGGCQTCYGAVDISNSDYKTIIRNSHYYVIAHMASVVKADATRIGTSGYTDPDIAYTAFENKDGSFSFIVTNSSASEKPFNINSDTKSFSYKLPANSIVSFQWGK